MSRFELVIDKLYLLFLFSSTVFTYSIHRIIGMKKVEKFAHKGRFAVISKYKSHIITYAILSFIGCIYSFLTFDFYRIALLTPAGLVSILYTAPVFKEGARLRDFSFIKIFLIAMVWSYVTESLPLYENDYPIGLIALLFLERFLFFIAITIPFDIRDIDVDRSNNVCTIPSIMGKQKSIYLSLAFLTVCILIEIYLFLTTHPIASPFYALMLTYLLTALIILWVRDKKDDYFFSGLLDGAIILPYVILLLFGLASAT